MSKFSGLSTRLRRAFQRQRFENEMAAEMREHIELETARRITLGEDPHTARRAVHLEFGHIDSLQERVRDRRLSVYLELLWVDVVFALRSLRRDPRFSVVVIVTLALGIGATTAIYSVVDRVLFNPVPGPDADRVVQIGELTRSQYQPDDFHDGVSPPVLRMLLENQSDFADLTWWEQTSLPDQVDGFTDRLFGANVSPGFFQFFGVQPMMGRTFTADEAQPIESKAAPESSIILSHPFWHSRFGGTPDIVGQTMRFGDRLVQVIGVMPPHFRFPHPDTQFWLPAKPYPVSPQNSRIPLTQLAVKTTLDFPPEQLAARLDTLAARLMQDSSQFPRYRSAWGRSNGLRLWSLPLKHYLRGDLYRPDLYGVQSTLTGLLVGIGFVLLMVCANIAHLTLARTERRRRELAVRAALGAQRGRLVRQLFTENALLALMGGTAGLVFATWGLDLLASLSTVPQLQPIALDGRVVAIAAGVAVLTVLGFGLMPAWQGGRFPIEENLKNGGNAATVSARTRRQSNLLVTLEIAVAVTLLAGAGLMIRSVIQLLRADPGLDSQRLLLVVADLVPRGVEWPAIRDITTTRTDMALSNLEALPGVEAVGAYGFTGFGDNLVLEDGSRTELAFMANVSTGDRDFFRAARVKLHAGRWFDQSDIGDARSTVLVSETLARRVWPGQEAVGKTFTQGSGPRAPTYQVVGVVGDFHFESVDDEPQLLIYRPMEGTSNQLMRHHLVLRTTREPGTLANRVRTALSTLGTDITRPRIETITNLLFQATTARRTFRNYLCVFGGAGLVLAALGVHGVLAYSVARRTREIGIRMALGADRRRIVRLIVGEGSRVILAGIALGLLGALVLGRFLESQLYGVAPYDPRVLGCVILLLSSIAAAACLLPANHAARTNPITALRTD